MSCMQLSTTQPLTFCSQPGQPTHKPLQACHTIQRDIADCVFRETDRHVRDGIKPGWLSCRSWSLLRSDGPSSCHSEQHIPLMRQGVALHVHLHNLAVRRGGHGILHLHGFQHQERLPLLDRIARLTVHLPHVGCERSRDLLDMCVCLGAGRRRIGCGLSLQSETSAISLSGGSAGVMAPLCSTSWQQRARGGWCGSPSWLARPP